MTTANCPTYGVWEEDKVRVIAGDPFGIWAVSDTTLKLEQVTLILPPTDPPNIVGVGINFERTARQWGEETPAEIQSHWQSTTSLTGRDRPLILPKGMKDTVRYQVQLGLVLRKPLFEASEEDAIKALFGYTGAITLWVPGDPREAGSAWTRGRSYDSTTSIGPFLQTEMDPDGTDILCRLNGEEVAHVDTSEFVFSCRRILSDLSHRHTLKAGTLILTGSIPFHDREEEIRKTAREGDIIEVEVEGAGRLSNPVVAA